MDIISNCTAHSRVSAVLAARLEDENGNQCCNSCADTRPSSPSHATASPLARGAPHAARPTARYHVTKYGLFVPTCTSTKISIAALAAAAVGGAIVLVFVLYYRKQFWRHCCGNKQTIDKMAEEIKPNGITIQQVPIGEPSAKILEMQQVPSAPQMGVESPSPRGAPPAI